MNQESLTFYNRTAKKGSFIFFPEDFSLKVSDFDCFSCLSKAQQETLSAIISVSEVKDSESTYDVDSLCSILEINKPTLNKRIRSLESFGILQHVPFKFDDSNKLIGRVKCIQLMLNPKLQLELTQRSTERTTNYAHRRHNAMLVQREYDNQGFRERPEAAHIPIVRQRSSFPFDQLVAPVGIHTSQWATEFYVNDEKGNSHKLVAQARSHSHVCTDDELMTVYSLLSLTLAYHTKQQEYYSRTGRIPENLTPIYVDDVLAIRKRHLRDFSGQLRQAVRDQLNSIRDTTFDVIGLQELELTGVQLSGYLSRELKIFKQCSPFTPIAPEISENNQVSFGDSAMLYLIEWPDELFNSLISDESSFAFPPNLLTVQPLIFMLFLRFRIKLRDQNSYIETLANLKSALMRTSEMSQFKETLKTQIIKVNALNDPHLSASLEDDGFFKFNLWGYHGVIDFECNEIQISINLDEALACCGIKSVNQKTPTIANPLAQAVSPLLKVNRTLSKAVGAKLNVERFKYHFKLNVDNEDIFISHYTTTEQKTKFCKYIAHAIGLPIPSVEDFITGELESLSTFKVQGQTLQRNHYSIIYKSLAATGNTQIDLSSHMILKELSRRSSLKPELITLIEGKTFQLSDVFISKLSQGLFIQEELPENTYPNIL
ncbi:replication initiator protein RctB domain-containing protein [Aliivibrio finisterrensis]|uniref:DUF3346 domain-containing protein n=1 Tax=Aliivibrio finisterrensis TaxID=511998 RepID=A0ABY0I6S5_9GAMM|nr:replication initiator protein RctB domain-containing protein [Aliivibrio finisterrensis]RYU64274.1 DUF3346 domain-containing protein [Aliivibrio finisterrensis]RYU83886.1 DUF3346 domain-containing protein [Aliivibrio finisterrensis]